MVIMFIVSRGMLRTYEIGSHIYISRYRNPTLNSHVIARVFNGQSAVKNIRPVKEVDRRIRKLVCTVHDEFYGLHPSLRHVLLSRSNSGQ